MTDINAYILPLLHDKTALIQAYRTFVDNCYSIDCGIGTVSPGLLHRVIIRARRCRLWREILTDLLLYADQTSLTDENFALLLHFCPKYRNRYLFSLAHCDLSFAQMQTVHRYAGEYESFAWLFDYLCRYDQFTASDVEKLIGQSPSVTRYGVECCIGYAKVKYGDSNKIKTAEEICLQMQ